MCFYGTGKPVRHSDSALDYVPTQYIEQILLRVLLLMDSRCFKELNTEA